MQTARPLSGQMKKSPILMEPPYFGNAFSEEDRADFVVELAHMKSSLNHEINRLSYLEAVAKAFQGSMQHENGFGFHKRVEPSVSDTTLDGEGLDGRKAPELEGVQDSRLTQASAISAQPQAPFERKIVKEDKGPQKTQESTGKKMELLWANVERKLRCQVDTEDDHRTFWEKWRANFHVYKLAIFETFMAGVVLLNALTIGLSCDVGSAEFWIVADSVFAGVFLLEIAVKVLSYRPCAFIFGVNKWWNLFELTLVVMAWSEVLLSLVASGDAENMNLLVLVRMCRLARVARLVRLFRLEMFSELVLMSKGAMGGMRTLFWSSVLIFWPVYVASLIFRETLGESVTYFKTVPMTVFTLFRCVIGDCSDESGRPIFYHVAVEHGWLFSFIYVLLMIFVVFGLFNVINAIYVENVVAAAKSDELIMRRNRLQDEEFFNQRMIDLITVLWEWNVKLNEEQGIETPAITETIADQVAMIMQKMEMMEITPDLFAKTLKDKRSERILQDLEIPVEDQMNLFESLDIDESGTLELPELYEGIGKLRGAARRSDIIAIQMLVKLLVRQAYDAAEENNSHATS